MALRAQAEQWIADDPDPTTRDELRALLDGANVDASDLADRFAGSLQFGTAGLRGLLGAGPNRMNRAVVWRATWGLAQELLSSVPGADERGVLVGGDARRMSREFCEDVAALLAAAGLRVVLFDRPVPTPLIGFNVKRLRAAAGVVITASHNPRAYNGYKVYWENAAQIVPPVDARIAMAIGRAPPARDIVRPALDELRARGRLENAGDDFERAYLDAVHSLAVHTSEGDRALRIVYTPLHGVGDALVRRALSEARFTNVASVPEQERPDGSFPTVDFPNPEEPGTLDLSFALAKRTGAALILANDPDADRLAVAIPEDQGYRQLTGNEVGALLGHYLLVDRPPYARSARRAVLASIVSSPLLGRIARELGVYYEETLTGFKWIANRAIDLEREGYEFVFGYEEALGYCAGSVVRDKDGISAALLVAELAAVLRASGRTLADELDAIARRWGVFASTQVNLTQEGLSGAAAIRAMMDALRASPPRSIAQDEVISIADYETGNRFETRTARSAPLTLPRSNVLALELASGGRIIARPSGTEPKAKFYFDVWREVRSGETVRDAAARARVAMTRLQGAFMALIAPP